MTFAIKTDHPLVPLWPRFKHDLIDLLDASPVFWSALEVFCRRRTLQPSDVDDTTVVVTAVKQDEQAWSDLQLDIEEYLMNQGQPALQVEIIDGAISRYASGETPGSEYTMEPSGGASVGVTGVDWKSGIFGGYLRLTQKGHALLDCTITCHHVLRPTREEDHTTAPSEPPPQYDPVLDRRGHFHKAVLMGSEENATLLVDQPSLGDHIRYLKRSETAIDTYQEQIKKTEKERDAGFDSSNLRRRLSRMQELVASMIRTS